MGTVYEVEHVELGKRFVLKALLRDLVRREDLVARLRNEWRSLGRLEHPNIVNVTDAGTTTTDVPFFVMERLDGETLLAPMRRVRRFPASEAFSIAAQIVDALGAAHDIGIVHRDVKPPNVFVSVNGTVKLLDFGVAKIQDASKGFITARGLTIGTPRYMSPEQARGEHVDGRSDIYAVGLLLFEMLAGVGPFDDMRDANDVLLAHIARPAPPLGHYMPGVPPEIEQLIARMLSKDCRERPASARELAPVLRAFTERFAGRTSSPDFRQQVGPSYPAPRSAPSAPPSHQPTASIPQMHAPLTGQVAPTRPDGIAGRAMLGHAPTVAAHTNQVESARLAPGGTQRMLPNPTSEPHSFSTPSGWGVPDTYQSGLPPSSRTSLPTDTLLDPMLDSMGFGPLSSHKPTPRTERLLEPIPAPNTELLATRTRVPAADQQQNSTPPPVVDFNGAGTGQRKSSLLVVLGAVAISAVLGVGALVAWKHFVPESSNSVAAGATTAQPNLHPTPTAVSTPHQPSAPLPTPTAASSAGVASSEVAKTSEPSSASSSAAQPVSTARAAVPAGVRRKSPTTSSASAAAGTQRAPEKAVNLPSSGL
jgi:serine/threonine-protein kinase